MIKSKALIAAFGSLFFFTALGFAEAGPKLPETTENVEKGEALYFKRCSVCHGLLGDGNGQIGRAHV